jgi:hypothetical protein
MPPCEQSKLYLKKPHLSRGKFILLKKEKKIDMDIEIE